MAAEVAADNRAHQQRRHPAPRHRADGAQHQRAGAVPHQPAQDQRVGHRAGVVQAEPADQPEREKEPRAAGDRAVEKAHTEQAHHAQPQARAGLVARRMVHAEPGLEHRIHAQPQGQPAQRQRGRALRNLQDSERTQHHTGQARAEDDERKAAFEMRGFEVPDGGTQAQRHAGDLVRGQRHAEGQAQKDQDGKLDQPRPAARQRRQEIGRQRGNQQDDLVEPSQV